MKPTSKTKAITDKPTVHGRSVRLEIRNLGNIIAKKNRMFAVVDKKNREWQKRCVRSFVFQLLSNFRETATETWTTQPLPSWIASSVPLNDSYKTIPIIHLTATVVPKGQEGADITIERL